MKKLSTEIFSKTNNLRWLVPIDESTGFDPVLQQMWQGSEGSQKWEDVKQHLGHIQ